MTQGALTTGTAASFPSANLPPLALQWSRAVMQRIAQLEDALALLEQTASGDNKTLIQTLRRASTGGLTFVGTFAPPTLTLE